MENTASILLPNPQSLFRHRAARFRQLAQTQPSLAGYLNLMADVADIQHSLADDRATALRLGSGQALSLPDNRAGMSVGPPLDIAAWPRTPAWREALRSIAGLLNSKKGSPAAILGRIQQAQDGEMETWAECLLTGELENIDPGFAPFVAAALQIHWTSQAARLDAGKIEQPATATLCPVCGSLPVAGVLQTGGSVQGLRYLCCGLCMAEWNRPRIHCVHCGSGKDVAYFGIEGTGGAVKAEACAECNIYIKLIDREKEPQADPCADDLATLPLDILLAGEGYRRLGFNPLMIPG